MCAEEATLLAHFTRPIHVLCSFSATSVLYRLPNVQNHRTECGTKAAMSSYLFKMMMWMTAVTDSVAANAVRCAAVSFVLAIGKWREAAVRWILFGQTCGGRIANNAIVKEIGCSAQQWIIV